MSAGAATPGRTRAATGRAMPPTTSVWNAETGSGRGDRVVHVVEIPGALVDRLAQLAQRAGQAVDQVLDLVRVGQVALRVPARPVGHGDLGLGHQHVDLVVDVA